jgi:hypothetical protein
LVILGFGPDAVLVVLVGTLTAVGVAVGLPALWILIRVATKAGVGF